MKFIQLCLGLAAVTHAYLIDVAIGPGASLPSFNTPGEANIVQANPYNEFDFANPGNMDIIVRLGINPHDDAGTESGDVNIFMDYSHHYNTITYPGLRNVDATYHDLGLGIGSSLPHAVVTFSLGVEYAEAYNVSETGMYGKVTFGGYISSSDPRSYNGMLIEMQLIWSKYRIGANIVFGLHYNGTKNYTDEELSEKEKEEEGWVVAGAASMAALGAISLAATSKDGGGGDSNDYPTCRYGCRCNDGTMSFAEHRQGACSWHGGISAF